MKKYFFISLFLLAFMACRHDHNHDHHHHNHGNDHHGHHHDEDMQLIITGYSEMFEIFAEADPLVVGERAEIVVHITQLADFKPLTNADITMHISAPGSTVSQTREVAAKDGIWYFWLTPEATGEAEILFEISKDDQVYRVNAGKVAIFHDDHDAIHFAEDSQPEHPTAITFTKEQSWQIHFATEKVTAKALGVVIKTVGQVLPARGDEMILSASTRGMVRFVSNTLYEGVEVQAGEVLLNISGEGLAEGNATLRYREARSNFERARADYERLSNLAEANIISQRELLEARNTFENAQAVFENLSANFSESGQVVRSPSRGFLTRLYVNHGEFAEAGQPLAAIARNQEMVVKTEIQKQYAPHLPNLATANLSASNGETFTLDELEGRILSRPRNADTRTHLLPVFLSINNQAGWITGSLLDVYLKTEDSHTSVVVPNSALIEEQGNYFVFVQLHPESFEKREIFPGHTDGIYTTIQRGLEEGERIVTRGAMIVKMAAAASDLDPHSGHMH